MFAGMAVMQPIRAPKKQKQETKCKNEKGMTVKEAKKSGLSQESYEQYNQKI